MAYPIIRAKKKFLLVFAFVIAILAVLLWFSLSAYAAGASWTQATASAGWTSRAYQKSVVFDNKMWIMGGYDGSYKNDTWYSTDGASWTQATAAASWTGRSGHQAVVFDNKMWVIGGSCDGVDVWYSTDGASWTQTTSSIFGGTLDKEGFSTLVFDNKMWIMGGNPGNRCTFSGSGGNFVFHSTDGISWTQATASANWSARAHLQSVVFDNKMWIMGGNNGPTYLNDVWYSTDGISWTQATASADWSARYGHSSVIYKNNMWVIGGYTNNVWYAQSDLWNP
jgi:type II secretory pathway pseudopilin PulG